MTCQTCGYDWEPIGSAGEVCPRCWPVIETAIIGAHERAQLAKLVATKRGRVLLVRRRRDHLWMFPGGRKRGRETEINCLRREIREELPQLKLGRLRLWKEVKARNRRSGRKMSDAIFVANKASGRLAIGDKKEIDKATWRKPRGIRLTPTSRYIRDRLFPKQR